MFFRTAILAGCMLVVPGLAVCSHRLPAGTLATVRRLAWDPLAARFFPAATSTPSTPAGDQAAGPPVPQAATPRTALADASADRTRHVETLALLGAIEIMTSPATTPPAHHLATCRVPVDAEGQLHRLFHAAGPDADAALRSLATEVAAWRNRSAATPGTAPAADRPRALRF